MKKFNEVISIQVPVDSIAQKLLDAVNVDFKHREILAEAIVGRMMNDGSLSYLYNSLNGYPCNIDFEIGDELYSNKGLRVYGYFTPESIEKNSSVYGTIQSGRVIAIDPYRDNKLQIQYYVPNKKGEYDTDTQWVSHTDWNKIPTMETVEADF